MVSSVFIGEVSVFFKVIVCLVRVGVWSLILLGIVNGL